MSSSLAPPGKTSTMKDDVLEQLVIEAKRYSPQTVEFVMAQVAIADTLLRARRICRPLGGIPLLNVQQEILLEWRQQLQQAIGENLDSYRPERISVGEWANTLKKSALVQTLKDANLKKIALAAQSAAPNTVLRQHLLRELIEAIRLSGRLCRPHREKFSPHFYELLYEEAVNETLLYVCQHIDKYDPERGQDKKFITWVNFRLDKLVLECRRRFDHFQTREISFPRISDWEMEQIKQPEEPPSLLESLRECLENDPEQVFQRAQIRNQPQANFRAIALARLDGESWEEISKKLHLAIPTLSSFYQRCCRKFISQFQQYLET